MNQLKKSEKELTKGFVFAASRHPAFYYSAMNLMDSIRDYWPEDQPEPKFALFTEEWMVDHRIEDVDYVQYVGNHIREKLYAMANSPWDITFYMDADGVVEHEDIATVFDLLEDDDMKMVRLERDPISMGVFKEVYFDTPEGERAELDLCGGVCLYRSCDPLVRQFMYDWNHMYREQENGQWNDRGYSKSILRWDQFTLWYLTNRVEKYKDMKIGKFEDNYRWNWFTSFRYNEDGTHRLVKDPPIFLHHSASMDKALVVE